VDLKFYDIIMGHCLPVFFNTHRRLITQDGTALAIEGIVRWVLGYVGGSMSFVFVVSLWHCIFAPFFFASLYAIPYSRAFSLFCSLYFA